MISSVVAGILIGVATRFHRASSCADMDLRERMRELTATSTGV